MRLLAVLLLVLIPTAAVANDAEYGNHAGTPAPVENTDVRMASEDIVIEQQESGFWKVDATYVFENTAANAAKLTMGFPELKGDPGKPFLKFTTEVDGRPVKVTQKKSAPIARGLPRGAPLGRVHLFDVEIAPKSTVTVRHEYAMEGGGSVAIAIEKTVSYVTRTGALWAGTIGRATFTIRTREVFELLAWTKDFQFKSLSRWVVQNGVATGMQLVLENTDWEPTSDLVVDMLTDEGGLRRKAVGGDCPDLRIKSWRKYQNASDAEKDQHLELPDLTTFDAAILRMCRNWIYARYGYQFSDEALNKRFYGKVHIGIYPPMAERIDGLEGVERRIAPLMADDSFTPAMLTHRDLYYVKALRAEERRRREQSQ